MTESKVTDAGLIVHAEAANYEWQDDSGHYVPTTSERAMLEDFGLSLLDRLSTEGGVLAGAADAIADAVMSNDHLQHLLDDQQRDEVHSDIQIEAARVIGALPLLSQPVSGELPRATPEQAKGGWVLDVAFLSKVRDEALEEVGEYVTQETVEFFLLRGAALSQSPPSGERGDSQAAIAALRPPLTQPKAEAGK